VLSHIQTSAAYQERSRAGGSHVPQDGHLADIVPDRRSVARTVSTTGLPSRWGSGRQKMHHVRRQPSSRDQRQEGHQVVTQLLACCVLASEVDEERSNSGPSPAHIRAHT
jgi:hypothetical protein